MMIINNTIEILVAVPSNASANSLFLNRTSIPIPTGTAVIKNMEIFMPLKGLININTEIERLEKQVIDMKGRLKSVNRYDYRPIDIDILCCGSTIIRSRELVIPHPHIKERKFVLKPWSDIDSDYIIANENRKIKELLESTTDSSILKKIQA